MARIPEPELDELRKLNPVGDPRMFRRFLDHIDALEAELEIKRKSYEAMSASEFDMRKRVVALEGEKAALTEKMECACGHNGGRIYKGRHYIHPAEGVATSHPILEICPHKTFYEWFEQSEFYERMFPAMALEIANQAWQAACADRDARVRLEVAAALRKAAEECGRMHMHVNVGPPPRCEYLGFDHKGAADAILALIPAADAKLLDAYVQEKVAARAQEQRLEGIRPTDRPEGVCSLCPKCRGCIKGHTHCIKCGCTD